LTDPVPTFGVDLGGTHLRAAVVDARGGVLSERRATTPADLSGIVDGIAAAIGDLAGEQPDARGVGIGAAGMIDHDGVIHYAPNIPAFVQAPLRKLVSDALAMPVVLDNDANVAALAELTHGVARGQQEVLCITLGTGVGGGIVTRGQILRGAHGFGAEVGHFQVDPNGPMCACGERGHWEAISSGRALGALGRSRAAAGAAPSVLALAGGVDAIEGSHVGAAAREGAPDAVAVVDEYARNVGIGLVGLVNILDPELVVVSGGLVDLGDILLAPLREEFTGHLEGAAFRPPVPIVASELGERAGVIGAAVLARSLTA
jgi:glucokinase